MGSGTVQGEKRKEKIDRNSNNPILRQAARNCAQKVQSRFCIYMMGRCKKKSPQHEEQVLRTMSSVEGDITTVIVLGKENGEEFRGQS